MEVEWRHSTCLDEYALDANLVPFLHCLQDDLRKDARLMEFNQIVNKSLRKDPESRRRELQIRTYVRTLI